MIPGFGEHGLTQKPIPAAHSMNSQVLRLPGSHPAVSREDSAGPAVLSFFNRTTFPQTYECQERNESC